MISGRKRDSLFVVPFVLFFVFVFCFCFLYRYFLKPYTIPVGVHTLLLYFSLTGQSWPAVCVARLKNNIQALIYCNAGNRPL